MDSFKELSPEEIKLATIQFMGQHLTGDLKVLDQHITNKTSSLQGLTIDPMKVLNTIPGMMPGHQNAVNGGIHASQPYLNIQQPQQPELQVHATQEPVAQQDPNQLEFNFEASPYSKQIFDAIDRIERKLDGVICDLKKTTDPEKVD